MCDKLFNKAWLLESIRPKEKLILLNLALHAASDGVIQIEQKVLAKLCFIGVRSVSNGLQCLKEKGLLTCTRSFGENFEREANIYQLTF